MGPSNSNKYDGDPCGIPFKERVIEGVGEGNLEEGITQAWAGSVSSSTPAVEMWGLGT